MPLIAGNKYSCEPCIRGHRATHCIHTDRILIEVRKPGRPLDRCCHKIASCKCGRLGNSNVLQVVGEKEEQLMISKEQPYGRELKIGSDSEKKGGERRKGKVFKRHRLGKEGTKSQSPVYETMPGEEGMDVDVGFGVPALSPSGTESEDSEASPSPTMQSRPLHSRQNTTVPMLCQKESHPVSVGMKDEKTLPRYSISISDLLS